LNSSGCLSPPPPFLLFFSLFSRNSASLEIVSATMSSSALRKKASRGGAVRPSIFLFPPSSPLFPLFPLFSFPLADVTNPLATNFPVGRKAAGAIGRNPLFPLFPSLPPSLLFPPGATSSRCVKLRSLSFLPRWCFFLSFFPSFYASAGIFMSPRASTPTFLFFSLFFFFLSRQSWRIKGVVGSGWNKLAPRLPFPLPLSFFFSLFPIPTLKGSKTKQPGRTLLLSSFFSRFPPSLRLRIFPFFPGAVSSKEVGQTTLEISAQSLFFFPFFPFLLFPPLKIKGRGWEKRSPPPFPPPPWVTKLVGVRRARLFFPPSFFLFLLFYAGPRRQSAAR